MLGQDRVGFGRGDLANGDVPPADFVIMRLKLDRTAGRNRDRVVPEVFQDRVIHDELVVQVDCRARTHLDHPEGVPLADRVVCSSQRILARRAGAVVPQPARAFVSPHPP